MSIESFLTGYLWPKTDCRFSGFQYSISSPGQDTLSGFAGTVDAKSDSDFINDGTLFDLASLTKLYTATLASILHAEAEVDLDSPLSDWAEVSEALANTTSRELLTHTSGLAPWWEEQQSRESTIEKLFSLKPEKSQRGELVYSCTGYSMFSVLIERKYNQSFEKLLSQKLIAPLRLTNTVFNPQGKTVAIAEDDSPAGEVHDPRAKAMDGVSGNAGLFANSTDIHKFLKALLENNEVITDASREQLFTATVDDEWKQGIGFRFDDHKRVGQAKGFFSHTGFTGTLAMLNPDSGSIGVLLSNRLVCKTTREQMAEIYQGFSERVSRGRVD